MARKLLQTTHGSFATLGNIGERKINIIDLAIDHHNKDFVAHRYCQGILDEMWLGRTPQCGRVRLSYLPSTTTVLLQVLLPPLKLLPLQLNDLYLGPNHLDDQSIRRQPLERTTPFKTFTSIWYIPLVKRTVQGIASVLFVGFTALVASIDALYYNEYTVVIRSTRINQVDLQRSSGPHALNVLLCLRAMIKILNSGQCFFSWQHH